MAGRSLMITLETPVRGIIKVEREITLGTDSPRRRGKSTRPKRRSIVIRREAKRAKREMGVRENAPTAVTTTVATEA